MTINVVFSEVEFETILDDTVGRLVSHQVVTKTVSNITGQETLSYASGVSIKVYFMKYNQQWDYQKSGFHEKGDAVMLALPASGVKKDDRIVIDDQTYRIQEAFSVPGTFNPASSDVTLIYIACNMRLVDRE